MCAEGPLDQIRTVLSPDVDLPGMQKLVLLVLIRHDNKQRGCFPSMRRIAACAGIDRTTAIRAIKNLTEEGVVGTTYSKGRSNRYTLNLNNLRPISGRPGPPVAESDQSQKATSTSGAEQPDQSRRATLTAKGTAKGTANTHTSNRPSDVQWFFDDWNKLASDVGLPQWRNVSKPRRKKALSLLKEYGQDGLREALEKVRKSAFLQGKVNGFRCNIDFLLTPSNFTKVIEGNYANRKASPSSQRTNMEVADIEAFRQAEHRR